MTMEQLSAQTVKIQLSLTELKVFLHDSQDISPNSPQMLRLISFLLAKSELYCEIPFSEGQVTVELLSASDGGLIFYFTCCPNIPKQQKKNSHAVRYLSMFPLYADLQECCKQLLKHEIQCANSRLYQCKSGWVLLVHPNGKKNTVCQHLLAEYGTPLPDSPLLRARLEEYGRCLYEKNAAAAIAAESDDIS